MSDLTLDTLLRKYDDVEKLQVINGKNINDQHLNYDTNQVPKMPKDCFFKEGDIFINKHHRFSYMPAHTHNFIEFNYMYSGSCTQYINDEKIKLKEHEMILIDKDIVQRIDYVGEQDILINILLKDDTIIDLLHQHICESSSLVTKFLYNASRMDAFHDTYIVFNIQKNEIAQNLIKTLILKSFEHSPLKHKTLHLTMALLLSELSNSIETNASRIDETTENSILPILKYIDEHYQSVTLSHLSQHFGYNTNYLGNKIKEETGTTFKELVDKKRLAIAKDFLLGTNYSTDEIANRIGFKSSPSLFRLFKKYTGETPIEFKTHTV